jgi:hypothetical protein
MKNSKKERGRRAFSNDPSLLFAILQLPSKPLNMFSRR